MITASSLLRYDATSLAHLYLGSFTHSSMQIISSSVRLDGEGYMHSYFQVSPEMFGRVQVLVHRVVVLLEGEPSPQSEVLSALEQVFIKDLSVLCSVHLSLDRTSLPVPASEKHPHSMMLPSCFTVGMVPGFLQT